jgi:hypothetical protein
LTYSLKQRLQIREISNNLNSQENKLKALLLGKKSLYTVHEIVSQETSHSESKEFSNESSK